MERYGVVFAMQEELAELLGSLENVREFRGTLGKFWLYEADPTEDAPSMVLALSGVGKVRAAAHTAELVTRFSPDFVISVGLSGSISADVGPGDVVIVTDVTQHDFDLGSIADRYPQAPLSSRGASMLYDRVRESEYWSAGSWQGLVDARFQRVPKLHLGSAITGDRLVSKAGDRNRLIERFPSALCVDMELYSVALVAREAAIEFLGMRLISDEADETLVADQLFDFCVSEGSALLSNLTKISTGLLDR